MDNAVVNERRARRYSPLVGGGRNVTDCWHWRAARRGGRGTVTVFGPYRRPSRPHALNAYHAAARAPRELCS